MPVVTPAIRARNAYHSGWARGWHLPERLSVWQWADAHRVLPRETSKEGGQWRTSRNPPAKAIMESLSPHSGAEIVTVVAGTQTVKTESMNNFVGYIIDHDPASVIVCQPTKDLSDDWKLSRFDALVETTPRLRTAVGMSKRRDSSNTMSRVKFPGGWLYIAHAGSPTSLASRTVRYVLADEVDGYEELGGAEGDVLTTLHRRADQFGRMRKIYHCSSPKKLMGASLIWREYLRGDQRECYVPCPHCDTYQVLELEGILPSGEYLCQHCGSPIQHAAKTDMLAAHEWRATHPERTRHHSYRLPSLYSPVGLGRSWLDIYNDRQAAGDDPAIIKAFVSTTLAIPYEPPGAMDANDLQGMAERWSQREPPKECLLLVAATDVQADRLETIVMGFGRGPSPKAPQIYVVDYHVTLGSPVDPDTFEALQQYLEEPILNPYGQPLTISLHAVDSGNWTNEVYIACHERTHVGWVPVKGASSQSGALISGPKAHAVNWRGRPSKYGGHHHMVNTNVAKDALLDRLAVSASQRPSERWWHLPADLPESWYAGMVAERRDPETGRWQKTRANARNEAIDVAVYAWAIAHLTSSPRIAPARLLKLQSRTQRDWDALTEALCPIQADLFRADPTESPPPLRPPPQAADWKRYDVL